MEAQKIEKLDELLKDFLGHSKTVTGHETTRLTALGENYGSTMLALKIDVQQEEKKEKLEAVGKVPPPGEFIQRMFNTPITFRNEINFYKIIVPELENFLAESGIENNYLDCFPMFYGARLNLTNKEYADNEAVLLLENLKVLGYEVGDRNSGFDLKTTELILKALAKFHAVPIAMKILKPEIFRKRIKPFFTPYKVFDMDANMQAGVVEKNIKIVEGIDDCKQYVPKVERALNSSHQFFLHPKNSPLFIREPFATIIHTDAWVNNFMVLFNKDEPASCKIVDFQLLEYGSPARDIIFFIFTSVQIQIVQQHYNELISLYHRSLIEVLDKLKCDTSSLSLEEFHQEITLVSKECEFFHCMVMLEPLHATKDSIKELDQYNEEDMTREKEIPQKHKEKASFIVKQFINRNFI
ncbi:EcKinase and/or DUF1679 domain containing protein [Asbolus verrucosus]|uniref:EcKinase and/or DUF1679 domain containing protein n=1 Tax=Asbolus verrucosus TaxID=1661398 RepID=A0A482VY17_ASBVE|nr:EcKinase and/or DUF1679 domain containing protein [Asbolus verrucosus]